MSIEPSDADESEQKLVADEPIQPSVPDATTPAMLRVKSDLKNLDIPDTCKITFPNGIDDPMTLEITIRPDEGHYRNGKFIFSVEIPSGYPYKPPKAKCETRIFHPNIDYEGNLYLNILKEDWVPVLDINIVVYGLYNLLLVPNWETSMNMEAATMLVMDPGAFYALVQETIPFEDLPVCHFSNDEHLDGFYERLNLDDI